MSVLAHPAPGTYSLAGFGPREPIKTPAGLSSTFHRGRDFSLGGKSFDVLAAADGRVRWAYRSEFGGLEVLIEHRVPGYPYLATRSAHLASFAPGIAAGAHVRRGQKIGRAGDSGRADGIHLCFQVFTDPALGTSQRNPDPFIGYDRQEDDDMAKFTDEHARALDWLDSRRHSLDVLRSMVKQLWERRTDVRELADELSKPDATTVDAEALAELIADELPAELAKDVAQRVLAQLGAAATEAAKR